jgi:hypothetical protein
LKYSSAGDVRNISVTFDVKFKVEFIPAVTETVTLSKNDEDVVLLVELSPEVSLKRPS